MSVLGKRKQYDDIMDDDTIPQHKRHKSGHHPPCAPPGYIYRDLEVVWARLEDFPWWPAQCDFTLLDGDKGPHRTPRLPVRWFGEDHNRVDWLTRDRIIPFSLEIESDLVRELKVEDEDQPEYIASIEDAVARQKKWKKDLEKERRQNKESDDEDFDPNAYKVLRKRRVREHNNKNTVVEDEEDDDDDEDEDEEDIDEEEDNFEVDEHGVIIDPEEKAQRARKKRKKYELMMKAGRECAEDAMDETHDKEEHDSDEEQENQDIDLFDDVGDVEKGYIENAADDANESFVVLNDNMIYEQQQSEERLKQMQMQQQQQELQRQRQMEIQRQQEVEQQQYLIQQQMSVNHHNNNNNNNNHPLPYGAQSNYNDVNMNNAVNYNGVQYPAAAAAAANQNYTDYNNQQHTNYNTNNDHNYYGMMVDNSNTNDAVNEDNVNVNVNQDNVNMREQHNAVHVDVQNEMTFGQRAQQAQEVHPMAQDVDALVDVKSSNRKKKMHKKHEIEEVYRSPEPAKMSVEEILKNDQHARKLKEITQQNEEMRASGNMDKQSKGRILKGLPFQLQQEIMTDNYVNTTPTILSDYFAHQNQLKTMDEKDANSGTQYYPQHFNRMKDKAKKDYRISNTLRNQKKRTIRTSGNTEKKKAPAYLRVASPEVLEKMHFDKQNRNALTLDHIVTKQYKNRGRKSGFFGSRNRYKRKSVTPKVEQKAKEEEKEEEKEQKENKENKVMDTAQNTNIEKSQHDNDVNMKENERNDSNIEDKNEEEKEGSITPKLKSVSLENDENEKEKENQNEKGNKKDNDNEENENESNDKTVERAWTKTNPETGEKEQRLHKKDTQEIEIEKEEELKAKMDEDKDNKEENKVDDDIETKDERKAIERSWTKTNPETGEREERLHRKDTQEMGGMETEDVNDDIEQRNNDNMNVDEEEEYEKYDKNENKEDNDDEMVDDGLMLTNSQEF